ncbi:MAG: 50S ribosomal protein L6 [Treponema sp.]|nr:MAG: 50S ribosomal protein L6 [Treponema sp.]
MSRIGKLPVVVPAGVKVSVDGDCFKVEGPKGVLTQKFNNDIEFNIEEKQIVVTRKNDKLKTRAFHGLYRSLLNNMVKGVSEGFTKVLVITGVGYKADVQGKILNLSLGYSNDFSVYIPDGLNVEVEQLKIKISGISKEKVGEFAAQVRKLRSPEPYKGKGIRYENEVIQRKVGKTGVK